MRKSDNQILTRQLTHFVAVAEAGSLNKAAEAIGVAQSALTRSLRQLEKTLDCQLFARGPRGSVITPEGEVLLECAHRIRSEMSLAMMAISHASGSKKPVIRVGTAPAFGLSALPTAIATFQARHPDFRIQVRQSPPATLMELLVSAELDIYVGPLAGSSFDAGIEVVPIANIPARIYARRDHPLTRLEDVGPADLLSFNWVALVEESGGVLPDSWLRMLERFAYESGASPPKVVVETNSVFNALGVTAQGDYLVCLSSMLLQDAELRGLTSLRLREPLTAHNNGIAFRSAIGRNAGTSELVALIGQEARRVAGMTA